MINIIDKLINNKDISFIKLTVTDLINSPIKYLQYFNELQFSLFILRKGINLPCIFPFGYLTHDRVD